MMLKRIWAIIIAFSVLCAFFGTIQANPLQQVFYYDNFETGYVAGSTEIDLTKPGIQSSNYTGTLSRIEEDGNGIMRFVGPKDIRYMLTSEQLGSTHPKVVVEMRLRTDFSGSNAFFYANNYSMYTFYMKGGYVYDKSNASGGVKVGTYTTGEWSTITIVYDNYQDARTIYVDGVCRRYDEENEEWIDGGTFASGKTGTTAYFESDARSFYFAPYLSGGTVDFDYIKIYKYPDNLDFEILNNTETDTGSIDLKFNFLPEASAMIPSNFQVNGLSVSNVIKDESDPNKYTLFFANKLDYISD